MNRIGSILVIRSNFDIGEPEMSHVLTYMNGLLTLRHQLLKHYLREHYLCESSIIDNLRSI